MKKSLIVLFLIFIANLSNAQFIKEKSINAQIGYGLSAPYKSVDRIVDKGFFMQGEFVLKVHSWLELRPYAGLILTRSDGKDLNDNPTDEKAESKAFIFGGKARVRAPIPWFAPYVEIGVGGSIGNFETLTAFTNIDKNGFIYHIPFSFGVELGRNNNVDLGFSYYFQPTVEQYVGAFALGVTIPLKTK
ncbi:porin family protein [Aquimarina sp. RZ0]|uniref:porin family protein n=1 Tax=Aquimarina sp. RZ0 TaxID=2607730 RepID=UPI0011F23666|nr:porin family protein [Aquimarina sp. RZ0]KAA1243960.1 porin family protein [Aquimarina sp. RZ0]